MVIKYTVLLFLLHGVLYLKYINCAKMTYYNTVLVKYETIVLFTQ